MPRSPACQGAGSLTAFNRSILGYAQANAGPETGHLEVSGGVLNCQAHLYLGFDGEGDLTVDNDGVVNDADPAILQAHWLQCNALDCSDVK